MSPEYITTHRLNILSFPMQVGEGRGQRGGQSRGRGEGSRGEEGKGEEAGEKRKRKGQWQIQRVSKGSIEPPFCSWLLI
jgi:hypothetical protein